jgi:antitoxin (DNA-binding transcriptional repressor) of toxin-antitoxin stability system
MRAIERGESFVLTRNATPIADLIPHARAAEHNASPERICRPLRSGYRRLTSSSSSPISSALSDPLLIMGWLNNHSHHPSG